LLARLGRALLPPPLDPLCLPRSARPEYCFADGFNRTFPLGPSQQPPDPFHANMTISTCAYLCQQHAGMTLAALEAGAQCFCANASGLAAAIASGQSRPLADCNASCAGNSQQICGGEWRLAVYAYDCAPWAPGASPWLDASLPAEERVEDLLGRLAPADLVQQLTQNGAESRLRTTTWTARRTRRNCCRRSRRARFR
jgi:hypothetical protein